MTLKRDDHESNFHAHPRHIVIRFQDRTLELGTPYPADCLEVDDFNLGTLTLFMRRARGTYYQLDTATPPLTRLLAQESLEIDISQPFPAAPDPAFDALRQQAKRALFEAEQTFPGIADRPQMQALRDLLGLGEAPPPEKDPYA
jgi:hypothetical protein